MNSYFASYLHYNGNDWVKSTHTYLLMPAIDFINNCVLTIGVKISKIIGLRLTILISISCAYISCFLLLIYPNYFLVLIAMAFFGVGSGFGYFPPVENCWKYYPTSNALIFGICVAGLGLSSSILTPLADFFIVNKDKKSTDDDGYYPEEVANNLKTYLYILTGIYAFLGVSAFILAFEYKEENNENTQLIEGEDENNKNNEKNTEIIKEKKNITVKELLSLFRTKKFLMILSFCICGLCKNIII